MKSDVKIVVHDNISEIIKTNKIHLSVEAGLRQAIYKENNSFSIDNPKIRLNDWDIPSEQKIEYVASFGSNKKFLPSSFDVELDLSFLNKDENLLKDLSETNIYFSCFALGADGKTKPKNLVVKLDKRDFKAKNLCENSEFTSSPFVVSANPAVSAVAFQHRQKPVDLSAIALATAEGSNHTNTLGSLNTCFLMGGISVLFLISLYFFVPGKKNGKFRFFIGFLLFAFALSLGVKVCLIRIF